MELEILKQSQANESFVRGGGKGRNAPAKAFRPGERKDAVLRITRESVSRGKGKRNRSCLGVPLGAPHRTEWRKKKKSRDAAVLEINETSPRGGGY